MRFAFAGTPSFGAWVLAGLVECERMPELVISQPSHRAGRGRRPRLPEVVRAAGGMDVPVLQTGEINSDEVLHRLEDAGVDMLVVAAFGQLLGRRLLGDVLCLNVHPSLLPAYRGAAPVARTLMDGERETGVCVMKMTEGLDEGPISHRRRLSLGEWEDAGSLERALALLGAQATDGFFRDAEDGEIEWAPQEGRPSYAQKIRKEDRQLDFSQPARRVHDTVRALSPSPGARAASGDLEFMVWRTRPLDRRKLTDDEDGGGVSGVAGAIAVVGDRLLVGCEEGALEIRQIQPAGKKVMQIADFLRGYGDRLKGKMAPFSSRSK